MGADSREVLTRPAPPPQATLRYGEHADHIADVRLPPAGIHTRRPASGSAALGQPRTLVLFLHGGFWRSEYDRTHTGPLTTALAAAGMVVATPEYRRTGAPGGGWPGTFDDVAQALSVLPDLVAQFAATMGVRVGRVLLAGHSAGGHLALWAAAEQQASAVVALAPVADLRLAYELDLDGGAVAALLGGGPGEVPERYAAADPMARLPVGCPLVLVHGSADRQVPVELSRRYAAAATRAGDNAGLCVLSEVDHFALIDPLSKAWPEVLAAFRVCSA